MAQEFFKITQISRDDIISRGFPADQVNAFTDNDMKRLAESMAEDYISQMFWEQIDIMVPMMFGVDKPDDWEDEDKEDEIDEDTEYERERDKRMLE